MEPSPHLPFTEPPPALQESWFMKSVGLCFLEAGILLKSLDRPGLEASAPASLA